MIRVDRKTRHSAARRHGAMLLSVFIVLILVALLVGQSLQMLAVLRHNSRRNNTIRQSRELIDLAVAAAQQSSGDQATWIVDVNAQTKARIEFIRDKSNLRNRISVYYPSDRDTSATASWEGKL